MENKNHNFLIANTMSDIFYHLKNVQDLQIIGGCTGNDPISEQCATIRYIPELKVTEKHERYIDFVNEMVHGARDVKLTHSEETSEKELVLRIRLYDQHAKFNLDYEPRVEEDKKEDMQEETYESNHLIKDTFSFSNIHFGIDFFFTDDGTGMDTEIIKSKIRKLLIEL